MGRLASYFYSLDEYLAALRVSSFQFKVLDIWRPECTAGIDLDINPVENGLFAGDGGVYITLIVDGGFLQVEQYIFIGYEMQFIYIVAQVPCFEPIGKMALDKC